MPLVVSLNAREVVYLRNFEVLAETLGHSNFDGFDWAVGDIILFESGDTAKIIEMPDGLSFDWTEPVPMSIQEGLILIGKVRGEDDKTWQAIQDWPELFRNEMQRVHDRDQQLTVRWCLALVCMALFAFGLSFTVAVIIAWGKH